MRKLLFLTLSLIALFLATPAFASTNILLDGQKINSNKEPIYEENRVLVPLRAVSESLGCEVKYDNDSRTIRISHNGTFLRLVLDSKTAYVNDKETELDVAAKSFNGVTMVPLRFIAENLGLDVGYENNNISLATKDYAKLQFIDVGDGDAIYIKLPNQQDILIDAGSYKSASYVIQCLKSNNVDDIELLISTHPHEEQMGGISRILKEYKVERIIESGAAEGTEAYKQFRQAVIDEKCKVEVAEKQKVNLYGATFDILTDEKENWGRDLDGKSIVSLLTVGNVKFLFMGDVGYPFDEQINPGKVEVLKAALRGGITSTSQKLLDNTEPEAVIISVAKDNSSRYPYDETLKRIKNSNAGVLRTSTNGDVVVTTNGEKYSVNVSKNDQIETKKRVEPPTSYGLYAGDKNGDVFHWPGCRKVDDIDFNDRVWFKDANHAKDNGYQPCLFCKPE